MKFFALVVFLLVSTYSLAQVDQNATLLGVDADNDGIRDDVQAWIEKNYGDKPEIKSAAKQYAKALQNGLANTDDKEKSVAASLDTLTAGDCVYGTVSDFNEATKLRQMLKLMHSNTKERIMASTKQSEHFSGNSYTLKSKEEACKN